MNIGCPICSKSCEILILDDFLYRAIRGDPDYDQKKPIGMWYEKGGEWKWELAMTNSESEVERDEEAKGSEGSSDEFAVNGV